MEGQRTAERPAWTGILTHGALWAGVAVGLATPFLLAMVEALGRNIPQGALSRDYFRGVLWACVVTIGILVCPFRRDHKRDFLVLWGVRCVVTLGFMLLYEFQYNQLDAYMYFADAQNKQGRAAIGLRAGTEIVTDLARLHDYLVPASYHALKVTFSLVGLVAVYLFYRAGVLVLGREDRRLFYVLGLFPSILFWSSIFGKDPVVLLGIAVYTYGVVAWLRTRRLGALVWVVLGLVTAAAIRFWLAPILLVPLIPLGLRAVRGTFPRILLLALVGLGLWFALERAAGIFRIESAADVLSTTSMWSQSWAEGGSAQKISADLTSVRGVLTFAPIGAFTALFRPLPGEIMNPFGILAGLEGLLLLVLLAMALVRTRWRTLRDPLVMWAVILVCTWATVYGFVSYQNLGTAVRFKLQILPLLLGLLLHLAFRPRTTTAAAFSGNDSDVRI